MSDSPFAGRMDGHLGAVGGEVPDHVPAPSGHAPRLVEHEGAGDGVTLHEPGADGAWITAENALPRCLWE